MISAVIFDLDGTLVETNVDFALVRDHLGIPQGVGILEHIAALPERDRVQAQAEVRRQELAGAHAAVSMPGAASLLAGLDAADVPYAVVTRNTREAALLSLEALGVQGVRLLAREDCTPKPDPKGPLLLATEWGTAPSEILFVGDFIWDLLTAEAAGMPSCLFAPPFQPRPELEARADHVVRELGEVLSLLNLT